MKAAGNPWMKFYPTDWRADPALRSCSIAARGLWIEMLCIMHEAEPYGSLLIKSQRIDKKRLASLCGIPEKDCVVLMLELEGFGVFERDLDGTIYSRRMRRDAEKSIRDKTNGADGGNPTIRRGTVPKEQRVRPFRRSDAPEKTLRIFAKTGGKCHWCSIDLKFEPDSSQNGFHVDHVLPICDGGTNDEENLVPACAGCNHKRARLTDPTASPVNVGLHSDVKAQKPEAIYQKPEQKETREVALSSEANTWFETFWFMWPNKVGKPAALKAFRPAMKRAPSLEAILTGVENYIRDKPPDRPWLNPATFLNQNRWEDQPAQVQNGKTSNVLQASDNLVSIIDSFGRGSGETYAVRGPEGAADVRLLSQRRG